ncbi:MAG: hypothetical protein O7B99_15760 [Planctomycetota bacterium]|nr:hypothetical protein [Planctomycetota bacterium]
MPQHLGIDVEGFLASMQAVLRPLVRARPGEDVRFDLDARPLLGLRP